MTSPTQVTDTPHAAPKEPPCSINLIIHSLQQCVVGAHLIPYLNAKLWEGEGERNIEFSVPSILSIIKLNTTSSLASQAVPTSAERQGREGPRQNTNATSRY